jgi:GTP:adenosylcobinamide-phosphate guanylyltransferase
MNILIPMAGLGSRFSKSHPNQIKPLIDVCGKLMIQRVIDNLNQLEDIISPKHSICKQMRLGCCTASKGNHS